MTNLNSQSLKRGCSWFTLHRDSLNDENSALRRQGGWEERVMMRTGTSWWAQTRPTQPSSSSHTQHQPWVRGEVESGQESRKTQASFCLRQLWPCQQLQGTGSTWPVPGSPAVSPGPGMSSISVGWGNKGTLPIVKIPAEDEKSSYRLPSDRVDCVSSLAPIQTTLGTAARSLSLLQQFSGASNIRSRFLSLASQAFCVCSWPCFCCYPSRMLCSGHIRWFATPGVYLLLRTDTPLWQRLLLLSEACSPPEDSLSSCHYLNCHFLQKVTFLRRIKCSLL